ncbi:hypothetical protein PanWU01x14_092730 [Parasponia andersonii]|uniref:Uncharacterized protein n=1 Tax=Parasponia andersonii TaxID=3476 RepID=A0A2P5D6U3_PARAD|nr:hypothetical protein PanWU01x14_092730 [Parasponia andersonii]
MYIVTMFYRRNSDSGKWVYDITDSQSSPNVLAIRVSGDLTVAFHRKRWQRYSEVRLFSG